MKLIKFILALVFFVQINFLSTNAEPMPSASLKEACNSTYVVSAEYKGYTENSLHKIDYFNPPLAKFQIDKVYIDVPEKGGKLQGEISVIYDFDDLSSCMPPTDWHFSEKVMPKIGSRWILFLQKNDTSTGYSTYRGQFGRMELGEISLGIVELCEYVNSCSAESKKR